MLRGPAGLVQSVGEGISIEAPFWISWSIGCDRTGASFRDIRSCVNRSASGSAETLPIAPLIVFGRPCKAWGFGCTAGLDTGVGGCLCGEEEYGVGVGIKSSSWSESDTGVGGIDSGR